MNRRVQPLRAEQRQVQRDANRRVQRGNVVAEQIEGGVEAAIFVRSCRRCPLDVHPGVSEVRHPRVGAHVRSRPRARDASVDRREAGDR